MELHAAAALPQKEHRYPLGGKLDGPQSPKDVVKKRKIFAPTEIRTPDRPASSLAQ
jgi:hypothetical protein